jgi:hypothetical protein
MGENTRLTYTLLSISQIKNEIEKMNPEQTIKHLRGDADTAFGKIVQEDWVTKNTYNIGLGSESFRPNMFTTFLK